MSAKKLIIPSFDPHEQRVLKMSFMSHGEQKRFLKKEKDRELQRRFSKSKK